MRHFVRLVPLSLLLAAAAPSRAQQDAEVEADAVHPQGQKKLPNRGVFLKPGVRPGAPGAPAPAGDGVKQLSENNYVVPKSTINNALTNMSDLATKARIVPSFKNGVANGFKLFSIVPDSLYSQIGIQNGDVIRRINGYEMNSPDKALEIYQKLRDASRVEIEIERRGETIRKSYSIE